MADLEPLINAVKERMGELIQKPKMTDKLLQKPPFRFLHDTITAVSATTGFGEGLYSGEELDSAAITDKQAKLNYLDKIFRLVGICQVRSPPCSCTNDFRRKPISLCLHSLFSFSPQTNHLLFAFPFLFLSPPLRFMYFHIFDRETQ